VIDFQRVMKIVLDAGFRGFVGNECGRARTPPLWFLCAKHGIAEAALRAGWRCEARELKRIREEIRKV
jgi:hypothetical protein